jgi:ribonuclease PH
LSVPVSASASEATDKAEIRSQFVSSILGSSVSPLCVVLARYVLKSMIENTKPPVVYAAPETHAAAIWAAAVALAAAASALKAAATASSAARTT